MSLHDIKLTSQIRYENKKLMICYFTTVPFTFAFTLYYYIQIAVKKKLASGNPNNFDYSERSLSVVFLVVATIHLLSHILTVILAVLAYRYGFGKGLKQLLNPGPRTGKSHILSDE